MQFMEKEQNLFVLNSEDNLSKSRPKISWSFYNRHTLRRKLSFQNFRELLY